MIPLWTSASPASGVRVGIDLGRRAVGRPAGVADARPPVERRLGQALLEVAELPLRAAAGEVTAFQRGDACGVVSAVFKPLQRVHQQRRNRGRSENADDSAHP